MKKINYTDIEKINPMTLIGDEYLLLTAGDKDNGYNTMTVSWAQLGFLWNKPVATIYVRPQRYTKQFIDNNELFTLSSYDERYKNELLYLGNHSGRDENKVQKCGFTPEFVEGTTTFVQSKLTFVCRKLYKCAIEENNFFDKQLAEACYPKKDYHDMYIAEIISVYKNN